MAELTEENGALGGGLGTDAGMAPPAPVVNANQQSGPRDQDKRGKKRRPREDEAPSKNQA